MNETNLLENVAMLFESSGMTVQQVADKSGVPAVSIKRYLAGETKNPGFASLCAVIYALGGSVDELMGVKQISHHTHHTDLVDHLRSDIHYERGQKRFFIFAFIAAMLVLVLFLIVDLLNPSSGWIQYARQLSAEARNAPTSFLLSLRI